MQYENSLSCCAHRVDYRFWTDEPFELTDELKERLDEEAEERIKSSIIEGYHSGQLIHHHYGNDDGGVTMLGWWEIR